LRPVWNPAQISVVHDLPDGPAVHAFENVANGKLYIGSSLNARRRVRHHLNLLRRGKHRNQYFQRAYIKHGAGMFRIFTLELLADCNLQELLQAEQRWISALATTEPERGYNIHPTPIAADYVPPTAYTRLRESFVGRERGALTESGRAAQDTARREKWNRPGEREFAGETMREIWATPEHRARIDETISERRTDPDALAAMRARLAAVSARRTAESRRTDIMRAWFERHARDRFASMEAMHDWIVAQYQSGESARRIGLILGMAHSGVIARLQLRGVVPAQRGAGRRKRHISARCLTRKGINDLAEFDRQVATLYTEGNSANAIRMVYGVSHEAIRTSLHRSGIALRGKGNRPSKIPTLRIRRLNSARARSPVHSRETRGC
jgi:hypothetical protein